MREEPASIRPEQYDWRSFPVHRQSVLFTALSRYGWIEMHQLTRPSIRRSLIIISRLSNIAIPILSPTVRANAITFNEFGLQV
jgi:hypothetical protein